MMGKEVYFRDRYVDIVLREFVNRMLSCGYLRGLKYILSLLIITIVSGFTVSAKDEIRVESELSVDKAYAGQAVCLIVRFYTTDPEIAYVNIISEPSISGATMVKAPSTNQNDGVLRHDIKKGEDQYSAVVYRCMFIPENAGTIVVPKLEFRVGRRKPAIIDHPFFGRMRSTTIEEEDVMSKTIKLKVNSLPSPPSGFSGAVGEFSISGSVPPGRIYADGTGLVVYTVSGVGNLQTSMLPEVSRKLVSGMRIKSETVDESRIIEGDVLKNSCDLVCEIGFDMPGEYEISPVEFIYFDPELREYVTVRSNSVRLTAVESELPSRPRPTHSI